MLSSLYPLPLISSILLLVAWTYFNRQDLWSKLWQRLFFLSMGAYMVSLFAWGGNMEMKFAFLFRDMIILATSGLLFQVFFKTQASFFTGLFFLLGGLVYCYQTDWFTKQPEVTTVAHPIENLAEDGELLVELGADFRVQSLENALADYPVAISRAFFPEDGAQTDLDDYFVLDILDNDRKTLEAVKSVLGNLNTVDWFEENETIAVAPMPAKNTKVNSRFGINDPGLEFLWGFEAMNVDQLYTFLKKEEITPKKKALIAILDTGVDSKHEDIQGNYRSIQKKYDDDPRSHGTHCAGIAASVSNNGLGVASFSPNSKFVEVSSIKVLNSFGMGTQKSIINGIIEAADNKADVISMSLGGRSTQPKQVAYQKAVEYALDKGAIVVAAAGNSNMDAKDYSPVNVPGVIGVSAINNELDRASFSNFVQNIKMGVAAPGVNIYSTVPGDKYASFNGTSMATPYVSGLIGLMRSLDPSVTSKEAFKILNSTGKATKSTRKTGRLIQPNKAVRALLRK